MNKLKLFEAFAGYGSQRMALRNIEVNYESVGISEIDIPAILSYASIHDGLDKDDEDFEYPSKEEMIKFLEDKNIGLDFKSEKVKLPKNIDKIKQLYRAVVISKCFGDVCLLNPTELPDIDCFTYSFPCTDLSIAGKQMGMERGQTRSGLLYECEKIIEVKRPKYLLLENVKNLVGKQFKSQFEEWLNYLESLGYVNYWKIINAKDYGVPQNRERVFCVSILKEHDNGFEFPKEMGCEITLKDVLEEEVEEKYYINTDRAKELIQKLCNTNQITSDVTPCDSTIMNPKALTIGNCITARYDAGIQNKQSIGIAICETVPRKNICIDDTVGYDGVRLYDGHTPTLRAERNELKVIDQSGFSEMFGNVSSKSLKQVGSLGGKHEQSNRVYSENGISPTIMAGERKSCTGGYVPPKFLQEKPEYRIRKLTPKECWRLMGCSDADFHKAEQVNSNTQLYKQAGNSIVVNVLEEIFRNMFKNE